MIEVNDSYQRGYQYELTEDLGVWDRSKFNPFFTPIQMLQHGVFEGRYLNECVEEFGPEWFHKARIAHDKVPNPAKYNLLGVKSRRPLHEWNAAGWCHPQDPRGWFQWYNRFYRGRRSDDDKRQISRHNGFWRHGNGCKNAAIRKDSCGDPKFRPVQRQACLQWGISPFPELSNSDSYELCASLLPE
jgi:hypothetical protein